MKTWWILALIISSNAVHAQDSGFVSITNSPCQEIYDLLKDSKGYIWLAHDLGVSRYDGHSFISFSSPDENALSVTDLVEDPQGRIWCHNFAGQIFFIDRFKLHLLKDYKFADEALYPRIAICGDELVATSAKGLFVLNTKTFSGKYYLFKNGSTSLTALNGKVLLYGSGNWWLYISGKGVSRIEKTDFTVDKTSNASLQPKGIRDTAFLIENPEGNYYKIFAKGNQLCLLRKKNANGFINAITIDKNDIWVHTRSLSFNDRTADSIANHNLTDVIKDDSGNIFISSLASGFSIKYSSPYIHRVKSPFTDDEDFIRKITLDGGDFVCGTQKGKILLLSKDFNILAGLSIPGKNIPIEQLFKISQDEYIIGTTIGTYVANFQKRKLFLIGKNIILKDFDIIGGEAYLATTKNLLSVPLGQLTAFDIKNNQPLRYTVLKTGRTRAIARVTQKGNPGLLSSFTDGVYELDGSHIKQLLFNGQPIYATIIRTIDNNTIIGTFNQGLFVTDGEKIKNITSKNGLLSNSIKNIKISTTGIWVISFSGFIQKMNRQFEFVPSLETPFKGNVVFDLEEKDKQIYVATNNRFYRVEPYFKSAVSATTSVDFILINGIDSSVNRENFQNRENNMQINLSTPFFNQFYSLQYRYRFYNNRSAPPGWQASDDDQRSFSLIGLQPGKYIFEAVAINPLGQPIANPLTKIIIINPAWYQTAWFKLLSVLASFVFIFYIVRLFFLYNLRKKQHLLEKQIALEQERQRISSDLHDDIGSTLSSINIYAGLGKNANNKEFYLDSISQNVNEVVGKLDDLVWSISPRYETLGNIAERLHAYGEPVTRVKEIAFTVEIDETSRTIKPPPEIKHHLLMMTKELINNSIKHSGCKTISVRFGYNSNYLSIAVTDDGKGIDKDRKGTTRNGLRNIAYRVSDMKGKLDIQSLNGKGTCAVIQIPF